MKKISLEKKLEIIEVATEIGIVKTAKIYDVSRVSISNWIKANKESGAESLKQKERVKSKHPKSMDEEILKKIIELKKANPTYSTQKIKDVLNLKYSRVIIHKKLRSCGLLDDKNQNDVLDIAPFSKLFLTMKSIDKNIFKNYKDGIPQYRIVIEDKITGLYFTGLAYEKTELSIGIFTDYIFFLLKKMNLIDKDTILYTNHRSSIKKSSLLKSITNKFFVKLQINEKYKLVKAKEFLSEEWIYSNKDRSDHSRRMTENSILQGDLYSYEIIRNSETIFNKFKNKNILLKKHTHKFNDIIYNSFPIVVDKHIKSVYNLLDNEKYWEEVFLQNREKLDTIIVSIKNIAFSEGELYKLKRSTAIYDKILFSLDYTDNLKLKIDILKERANALLQAGKWEDAENNLNTAYSIAKKSNDKFNIADILRLLGQTNHQRSKKYIKYSEEINNFKMLSLGALNIGDLYFKIKKLGLALKYYKKVIVLFSETENIHHKMTAIASIGTIYFVKGEYEKAIRYLEESYSLAVEHKDKQEEMRSLGNLGVLNYTLGDIRKSEEIFIILYENSVEMQNQLWISSSLNNLLKIYITKRDYGQSLNYCTKLLANAKKMNNKYHLIMAYGNYAGIYLELKKYDSALKYIDIAIKISGRMDNSIFYLDTLLKKNVIYYKSGNYNKVKILIEKAKDRLNEINSQDLIINYHLFELKNNIFLELKNKTPDFNSIKIYFEEFYLILSKNDKKRNKLFSDYSYLIKNYYDLYLILLNLPEKNVVKKNHMKIIGGKISKYLQKNKEITKIDPDPEILATISS